MEGGCARPLSGEREQKLQLILCIDVVRADTGFLLVLKSKGKNVLALDDVGIKS